MPKKDEGGEGEKKDEEKKGGGFSFGSGTSAFGGGSGGAFGSSGTGAFGSASGTGAFGSASGTGAFKPFGASSSTASTSPFASSGSGFSFGKPAEGTVSPESATPAPEGEDEGTGSGKDYDTVDDASDAEPTVHRVRAKVYRFRAAQGEKEAGWNDIGVGEYLVLNLFFPYSFRFPVSERSKPRVRFEAFDNPAGLMFLPSSLRQDHALRLDPASHTCLLSYPPPSYFIHHTNISSPIPGILRVRKNDTTNKRSVFLRNSSTGRVVFNFIIKSDMAKPTVSKKSVTFTGFPEGENVPARFMVRTRSGDEAAEVGEAIEREIEFVKGQE